MSYRSLSELDEAHQHESTAARHLMEDAGERLRSYRSRMTALHETAHQYATNLGVADHPAFREVFQRAMDETHERIREGSRAILELEEHRDASERRRRNEREEFLTTRSRSSASGGPTS